MKSYRIALLSYHPMPYHVSFYRALHEDSCVEEKVLYLDDFGIKPQRDPEFNQKIYWDNDILVGYNYKFFHNFSWGKFRGLICRINPGVFLHITRNAYDAILIDYATVSAWLSYIAALVSGCPVIMRTESDLDRPYNTFLTRMKRMFLSRVLCKCSAVMYSCEKNKQYFLSFGVPEEKLFPLLSSVDNEFFLAVAKEKNSVRKNLCIKYRIPESATVILFSGRLIERKRPLDLLLAFEKISKYCGNLFLVYVGDGPQRKVIEDRVRSKGISKVLVTGFINQSELWKYYLLADIFVMPSEWDPTPKALNEAAISGLPCIVSDMVGQANDLIISKENGYVFPMGDQEKLSDYIKELVRNSAKRKKYSLQAIKKAKEWSPQSNVNGLVAALEYIYSKNKKSFD